MMWTNDREETARLIRIQRSAVQLMTGVSTVPNSLLAYGIRGILNLM
jgi:hypothetical protein